jgi:hypothetical protein
MGHNREIEVFIAELSSIDMDDKLSVKSEIKFLESSLNILKII